MLNLEKRYGGILKNLFKFLCIVALMIFFYPILGIILYRPLIFVCDFLHLGSLISAILMHMIHLLSVLGICLLSGVLFPRNRLLVRSAAMVSISWYFVADVIGSVYISANIANISLFSLLTFSVIPFFLKILFAFLLSDILFLQGTKISVKRACSGVDGNY